MKRLLVMIYQYIMKLKRLINWVKTIPSQRIKLHSNNNIAKGLDGKVMVLIPHSDDEWIGTSRLITSSQDVLLCNMNMSGADNPELHHQRFLEMEQNAKLFSRELVQIDDSEQLVNKIRQYKPDYVFAPFLIDWHDEHHAVLRILYDAISILSKDEENLHVGMYQVSVPIPEAAVTHCFKMMFSVWLNKWRMFLVSYPSQKIIAYERFALQEVINGKYIGGWAGEVYSIWDKHQWRELYQCLTLDERTKEQIKIRLNDISWIRDYVTSLWNEGQKRMIED